MDIFKLFKRAPKVHNKVPTAKQDAIAYNSGGRRDADITKYTGYVESVEALDKAIRIIANIASMAKIETFKDVNDTLKPLKVKNVDFKYNTNDQDSSSDLLSLIFGSIFTHGSAIILTEDNKKTKFKNFFAYDVSRFRVDTTENRLVDTFVYTSESGTEVRYKPEDLIYIAPRVSPSNLIYATSRLKSLNDMLTLQASIMTQSTEYYGSGGKQSAIISPKEPMGVEKASQLKTAFDAFLQTPATKTLFINTEVDVQTVSNAQSPTQIMEALTKINNLIIEQFGIPAYLYGNYAGYVNDAAVVTACRLFFQVHMKPVFRSIEYQMTRYFRNTLGIKDCAIRFNFSDIEILEDSLQIKVEDASKMWKLGLISLNEARAMCELEELPDEAANNHFLPAYLLGQLPVTIENYTTDMEKLFASDTPSALPDGASGGSDNTSVVTDSTGGPGNLA
jgi:HK97 family phage portal protein